MKRSIRMVLIFAVVVNGVVLSALIAEHLVFRRSANEAAKADVVALTAKAASDVDGVLRHSMSLVDSTASDLTTGKLAKQDVPERLKSMLLQNSDLLGAVAAYQPYQFSPDARLHGSYLMKRGDSMELAALESIYDYTTSDSGRWYQDAIRNGAGWMEPFWGKATSSLITVYASPFYSVDAASGRREPRGVVAVTLAMNNIERIIDRLDLGPSGYGGLISKNGVYLYHPNREYVSQQKTILDIAKASKDRDRVVIAEKARRGERGILDHRSTTTGQQAWLVFEPVPSTGWSVNNTFIRDDIYINVDIIRRHLIQIMLSAIGLVVCLCALLIGVHEGGSPRLWTLSIVSSLVFAIGIGFCWNLELNYGNHKKREGVRVLDRKILSNYVAHVSEGQKKPPILIPTGLVLQSLEFRNANTVSCSGYLWQKYPLGAPADLARDFMLPDAVDEVKVREAYRRSENGYEVIGWIFMANLRQHFRYFTYPLDQDSVVVEIGHKQLNMNVMLVPDLEAYRLFNPSTLPGIRSDLELKGWSLVRTFFGYNTIPINTNYGIRDLADRENFQRFSFNVEVKRNFVDIFISKLIPLIMIAILLYATLLLISKDESLFRLANPVAARILQFCAAMFFIIIFAHIDTRARIDIDKIFYLEYFYFVMYVFLLYVSVTAILFAMMPNVRFIQYRDNFISKLVFWPVMLGSLLLITVGVFY